MYGTNPSTGIHCRDLTPNSLVDHLETALKDNFETIYVYDHISPNLLSAAIATYTNAHSIGIVGEDRVEVEYI